MTLRRDWTDAREAHLGEPCRVCRSLWPNHNLRVYGGNPPPWDRIELHHLVGRVEDERRKGPRGGEYVYVHPSSVVPLCTSHHNRVGDLDLWPFLHSRERAWAVGRVGEGEAKRRIRGRVWLESEAAA